MMIETRLNNSTHQIISSCMIVLHAVCMNVFSTITPSPPTKISGLRGFDSSKLLILRGGNSHVRRIV